MHVKHLVLCLAHNKCSINVNEYVCVYKYGNYWYIHTLYIYGKFVWLNWDIHINNNIDDQEVENLLLRFAKINNNVSRNLSKTGWNQVSNYSSLRFKEKWQTPSADSCHLFERNITSCVLDHSPHLGLAAAPGKSHLAKIPKLPFGKIPVNT